MCGRFYVEIEKRELREIEREENSPQVKFGEIFPTDTAPVLTLVNGVVKPRAMMWGLAERKQKRILFRARAA